jgi:hypothetical protein
MSKEKTIIKHDPSWSKGRIDALHEAVKNSLSNSIPFEGKTFDKRVAKFILMKFGGIYVE